MKDRDVLLDLEHRINHLIWTIQNTPEEERKEYLKQLNEQVNLYRELTGKPFQVTYHYELD